MRNNPLLASDSYKYSHWVQYPPKTDWMMSYFESRGGSLFDKTVCFGLQAYILQNLMTVPSMADIEEAKTFMEAHGEPFNYEGWKSIVTKGYWPIKIRAVPEGTVLPKKNLFLSIESTDENFWVVSWLETELVRLWYTMNVATLSWHIKHDLILPALRATSDKSEDDLQAAAMFMLHDFGARGASSRETAGLGGMAHLVNFMGSDTCTGIAYAMDFYKTPMPAFSIPAAEHSTVTMWDRNGEKQALKNMILNYGIPGKLFAFVSDSYDIENCIRNVWGDDEIKALLIASGAKGIVRPDSGHPPTMTVTCLNLMGDVLGHTLNSKGFKILPPFIGLIYGDGINYDSIKEILEKVTESGWCISNIAFGMGGALLQQHNRDTHRMAFKCCAARVDGEYVEVFKDPKSDPGKTSKKGILDLVKGWDEFGVNNKPKYTTVNRAYDEIPTNSALVTVYENGKLLVEYTLDEVRKRAAAEAVKEELGKKPLHVTSK